MNRRLPIAVALVMTCFSVPSAQVPDIPHGEVTKYTWKSTIFPGTERDYWVYVPAQYDKATPAAVMVFQDGAGYVKPDGAWKVHEAFDRLIAAGEMPVTIGIFINPGVVPPARPDALPRFNRSLEYDAVGDRYARFLIEEILPEVGKQYNLTADPNLRAIGGASSGAIAAFTVAWQRPDAFRRVFSTIGTYVGLRGGNDYPTYVRKTEPKPLRVFLQDGSADLNIYGGNWWVANQDMLSALEFSGYEVNHVWGDGGHDSKHGSAILADALRWLWKDWTTPIRAGVGSKQPLMDVLEDGSGWTPIGGQYGFADGPAASASGEVFFSDTKEGHVYKIGLDGRVTIFVKDAPGAAGLMFGPDGRLYAALHTSRQVVAYNASGAETVVASDVDADDLAISATGHIYVSDWMKKQLWHIAPDGTKTVANTDLAHPNGLVLTPDQTQLLVADMRSQWVWVFQLAADGSLTYGQPYCDLHIPYGAIDSGGDGMTMDTMGRPYVATRLGIQYCDQAGRVNGILPAPTPGWVANVTFGGADKRDLFVTVAGRVYKRHMKAIGVRSADAPITPPPPRL
jgi:gluconolactonase